VNPRNPSESGSRRQFEENIILEDPERGDLVLDILEGRQRLTSPVKAT